MDGVWLGNDPTLRHHYKQLITRYDHDRKAMWYYMNSSPRPCFTIDLLNDINHFQQDVTFWVNVSPSDVYPSIFSSLRYIVLASQIPGVFNLGGDLALFKNLICDRNREGLLAYAEACIDVLHANSVNLNLPITTISLVQGDALGGGFEAALSSTVLIAEKRAQMGLPEILFNLFPGMGAYNLLGRRIGAARAEKIILSGRIYSAEELNELGVVDILAEEGEGVEAVHSYIRKQDKFNNGYQAVHNIRQLYHPVTYKQLMNVATLWVDTALQLREKDLRIMERLARSQDRLMRKKTTATQKPILHERTKIEENYIFDSATSDPTRSA